MTWFMVHRASRNYGPTSLSGLRHEDVRKLMARQTHGNSAARHVLDVGCGRGELLRSLRHLPFVLHGCDWLPSRPDGDGIDYRQIDLNRSGLTGYADAAFDVVLCSDVIEHMESPAMILREIARVLSPDGFAIVSFPNSWNLLERLRFLMTSNLRRFRSERVSGPWGHISFFTPHVLESLCDRAELELVSVRAGDDEGHMAFGGFYMRVPASLQLTYNVYVTLRKKPVATQAGEQA